MVSYVLAVEFGSGWPPLGKPVEVEVCSLGALFGSTTECCYRRSVLEDNVKGGSCVYGQCISAVRICESRMPGMLGKNSCWQGWFGAIWRSRYTSTEVVIIC